MKIFRSFSITVFASVFSLFAANSLMAQGGTTPAIADNTPITLPFSAAGTTVGAGNNVDSDPTPGAVTIDGGNDYFYYFCATTTGVVYATLTYNGSATPQIFPSLQAFTDLALTNYAGTPGNAACSQMADPNTSNTANTIGFPILVTAGQCYYIMVDNANYNTSSYNYTLSLTYSTSTSTPTLQPSCTNMGFDNGTTSGWVGNWGHSVVNGAVTDPTPSYTPVYTTLNAGHHNVTTGGIDPYIGAIQEVCPLIPGNTNSLRLGDGANASFGGAQIMQKFSVTSANALLTYYYAAVMQDAGSDHQNYEQPFFKIEALDCSGNPITCGNYLVTGGPGIPGFIQVGTSSVYYRDWTAVLLDLTPYIGTCVTIKFTVGDCSRGAHFAYAYLDATCGPVQISTPPSVCQFNATTLHAPTGGASYSWIQTSNPSTVLGTDSTLTITPTTTGTFTYQCTITSVTGCNTTVQTTVTVNSTPQITVTNPPPVCTPSTVDITSSSVVTITSGTGTLSYFQDAACTVPLASPSALASGGTYYIKITNANGCYEVEPVTVTINTTPTVDVTTANQSICTGQSVNLNATISPAAGTNPVSFTNTADFPIPDGTGVFVGSPITVSGVNAQTPGVLPIVSVCLDIAHTWDEDLDIVLQCPDGTQIYLASAVGADGDNFTSTCFVPVGTSISSGTAPFTGSFSPMQPFSNLNACTLNGTWTLLAADFATGDSGTILDWTITFNNYTPGPTYAWSPTTAMTNSTTLTPTVSPTTTTTYTFTGTSASGGCTSSDPVTITVNPLPTATISGTTTVCQNATAPTITFTGANGTPPYVFTYTLNGGANQTVSSGAGNTATVTQPTTTAGTFTYSLVSVSCTGGCSQTQSGTATVTVGPTPTITGTATVCVNSTTTLTGSGTPAASNPWTSSNMAVATVSSTGVVTGVSAGTSTITYTNSTGCTTTQTVTVNPLPTATISGTTTVCQNAAAPTITFTGANGVAPYVFTYTLNGGANQTLSSGAGNTATVTQPTTTAGTFTYSLVSVSCTGGCSQTQSGTATVTVGPTPTITGTATVCVNSTTTLTGSGTPAASNPWTSSNTAVATVSSTGVVTGVSAGTSTITYTNSTSCTTTQTVTVNPLPTATISGTTTVCQNATAPTITFTGAGATAPYTFTYTINGGANQTVSSGAGTTATVTAPTGTVGTFTYSLISVSSGNGCSQTQSGSAVVTVSGLPTATISGTTTVCQNTAGPVITFTGANGVAPYTFTYNINGGANQTVSSGAGSTATVTASTSSSGTFTYTLVSVSSSTGCNQSQTGNAVITVNPLPTATISGDAVICQGGTSPTITFTGSGSTTPYTFTYNINGGANQTISSGAGNTATVSASTTTSGTFVFNLVSVSAANGCSQTQSGTATVTVGPLPTAQIQGDATVCQNDASPLVTFTGANGVAPYSFDYTINGGAVQTATTTGNNSSVTVSVPTGTAGTYTYALQNVSTPNGCSQTQNGSVSIVVNALPVANPQADTALCAGSTTNQVNFSSTPSGATFGWTNSDPGIGLAANGIGSVPSFTALNSGNTPVTATITYAPTLNGCIGSSETFTITVSNTPVSFAGADVGLCQNSTGAQIGTTSQAGLSYSWLPATGLSNPNGSSTNVSTATAGSTTYTVTTTNVLGCYSTDDVVVTINPLPTVGFVPDKTSGCAPLEVRFTNTSSSNSVNCDWFFGDGGTDNGCGGVTYTFETPGVWDVTLVVTDNNGCQNSLTQSDLITVLPEVYAEFSADHYQVTVLDPSFHFTNYSQNATNYSWTFGDGSTSTMTDPNHTYQDVAQGYTVTLVASNAAGCVDTAIQHITIIDELIFYVPNVFTPDGDEYNNTFYPVFTSGFDEMSYTMYIFDRWGEIIFESHDWNIGWDGTYHNVMCKEGVYTWKILVKEKVRDKHHEYHGHVTLLK